MSISSKVCKFLLFSLVQGTRFWFHKLKNSGTLLIIIIICDVKVAYFFFLKYLIFQWCYGWCSVVQVAIPKKKIFFLLHMFSMCNFVLGIYCNGDLSHNSCCSYSFILVKTDICILFKNALSWQSPLIIVLADWRVALDLGSFLPISIGFYSSKYPIECNSQ